MQIHTDIITDGDMYRATTGVPGVYMNVTKRGSRGRARKFDFTLDAVPRKGRRLKNTGNRGASESAAATWDEWGMVLARLFDLDPDAFTTGGGAYESGEHFHWVTGGRFANGGPVATHDNHRWEYAGRVAGDAYDVMQCRHCPAITRRMAHGHDFSELQAA